ncbi:protein kinase domain-containing protein [Colletotrichum karsti]|uniref:Protein kinase domain-containing protein n=1 Tax=Colletotrichum karsti TaxID=1095194 RepID=A0A9P6IGZ6_9PEZI|nr:protein kinase domain-containing protein [Colletotrichum karsti]KAF9878695.1 protein kinase domain-containing protein [Colletotrichum karsti]
MEEHTIDFFCDNAQWRFLAPVFREKQFKYDFHPKCPMPYLTPSLDRKAGHKDSHFSVVEQRCIHKDHLKKGSKTRVSLDQNGHPLVAIKQLRNVNWSEKDFQAAAETEADVLEMIRDFNHPHLIRAIAYYTRGKKHFLVFPWADGGNLRDFWESEPPRKLDGEFFKWAFDQLCGLAGAMEKLHSTRNTCRHGDLKPENILCFENTGHTHPRTQPWLVIADVGLAKVHNQATHLRHEATRTVSGTVMYEPPEAVLAKNEPRSRRYDVWSLGCIYLEFLIWILFGKDQLTRFGNDITSAIDGNRKFFEINTGTAVIKPAVQKWIDSIRTDRRVEGNTAVMRLLDLICNRLLVVAVGNVNASSSGSGTQTPDVLLEANGPGPGIIQQNDSELPSEIEAPSWDLSDALDLTVKLDDPDQTFDKPLKCIVLARAKDSEDEKQQLCYVLLISGVSDSGAEDVYERVGAGKLRGEQIDFSKGSRNIILR